MKKHVHTLWATLHKNFLIALITRLLHYLRYTKEKSTVSYMKENERNTQHTGTEQNVQTEAESSPQEVQGELFELSEIQSDPMPELMRRLKELRKCPLCLSLVDEKVLEDPTTDG